jgi:hypothetical protein
MNCSQKKIVHSSKEITMAVTKGKGQMKDSGFSRPYGPFSAKEAKKVADAIEKESTKKPAPKKPMAPVKPKSAKTPMPKAVGAKPSVKKPMPKTTKKAPGKKVVQMPSKISPSKMTPAQKAKYLANPERYDG